MSFCKICFRLEDYKRNFNFKSQATPAPSTDAELDWPTEGFRQLTNASIKLIPSLTSDTINGYFTQRLAMDDCKSGDSQALVKGRLLQQSNRVIACSMLVKEQETFVSAICRAAMKKGVRIRCCKSLLVAVYFVYTVPSSFYLYCNNYYNGKCKNLFIVTCSVWQLLKGNACAII